MNKKQGKNKMNKPNLPESWLTLTNIEQWTNWLEENHQTATQIWLKINKIKNNQPGIKLNETIIEALRYGWIDGIMHSLNEESFIIRLTPRRKNSIWSLRNKKRAQQLIKEGRMTKAGMKTIQEAQQNGRWDQAE